MLWWQLLGVFTLLAHWLACGMFWSGGFTARFQFSQWQLCFLLVLLLCSCSVRNDCLKLKVEGRVCSQGLGMGLDVGVRVYLGRVVRACNSRIIRITLLQLCQVPFTKDIASANKAAMPSADGKSEIVYSRRRLCVAGGGGVAQYDDWSLPMTA